ncbi:MAG: DUF4338 domain-containing protein, partial [Methyloprofundus sp.]|nr:DUF4338 domain-containing protein [Methyloprofundus sp.]
MSFYHGTRLKKSRLYIKQPDLSRWEESTLLLLETFVDPQYFHGTIYRAANWMHAGDTRG